VWGKIIGGMAGFAMGGPFGAVLGAALGHAAESGGLAQLGGTLGQGARTGFGFQGSMGFSPARLAALLGQREQVFAICVVVLSAKLAKCDGTVNRAEIDAFKRHFRIPPESASDVGRLFDQARDSTEGYQEYALQLGESFADNLGMLEDVLAALFAIAGADGPVNAREQEYLRGVARGFELSAAAWERASGGGPRRAQTSQDQQDPYEVLGVPRTATDIELRAVWKRLMRENHPDSLASRGVPPEFIARAGDKVARINAAWDRIKRERGL
jgi:DnaJ like chaperone protein